MFRLYHSNDLDVLKELLVHQMKEGDGDPFIPEQILVQSQGMAHWLKLQIAESLGIAANIEFPLPSSFVWKIYNAVKPDLPKKSHFEKELMTWKLMRLLPTLIGDQYDHDEAHKALFLPIAHYLEPKNTGEEIDQKKIYALAEKIADTFDQYLVYRPDWLLAWEAGQDEIEGGDVSNQPWQPELWRRLVKDSEQLGHSLFHRARLTDELVDIVREGHTGLKDFLPTTATGQPARIFVFGIAALPGTYWQVLNAISEYIDVHFFLLNPCRNYWGDIVSEKTRAKLLQKDASTSNYFTVGNPLLASWGKLGRDFITLTHEAANDGGRGGYFQDIEAFKELGSVSSVAKEGHGNNERNLLQNIQYDFLELLNRSEAAFGPEALNNSQAKVAVKRDDKTIQMVSAHSPLREVQTLFDQMLSWFDDDLSLTENSSEQSAGSLKPRDILVMVPDIEVYAPYIEAVFGSASDDQRIPWAIADQALNKENLIIDSFLRLLQLPSSRLTITDVIELLEVPAISQQFEIELTELDQVKQWLNKANIRWGLDEDHRADLGLPSWSENTWFKGLQQLLLGLVMPDNAQSLNQYWPVASVTGSQGELLGKLMAFIDQLDHWYQRLSDKKSLTALQWQDVLLQLISDFYPQQALDDKGLNDQVVLQKIRDQLQSWQDELLEAGFTTATENSSSQAEDTLSHGVVLQYLTACLTKQVGWQRFLAGPVNFCTLMPMRSIPFRVVCMLGMNDEDYPRRVPPQGFDLMAQGEYRRGDRSRREDDRYLFLEAVIAAQEKLYISYRGRDSRENTEMQPCVLVSELIDYIGNGYVLEGDEVLPHKDSENALRKHLITEQKLQPFNSDYFVPERPFDLSYQGLWQQVAQASEEALTDNHNPSSSFVSSPLEDDRDSSIRFNPELDDIKQCLINPCKFFIQRRLNVNLTQYWDETEIDEPFELDNLQSYLLNESILNTQLAGNEQFNLEMFKQQQKSLGHLPVANFADYLLNKSEKRIAPLVEAIEQTLPSLEKMPAQSFSISLGTASLESASVGESQGITGVRENYQLTGQLEHLIEQNGHHQVFHFRSGSFRGKQVVNLWLEHLFACAAGLSISSSLGLGMAKKQKGKDDEIDRCEFSPVPREMAQSYLLELIEFMNKCYQQPQAFFLTLAMKYLTEKPEKQLEVLEKSQDSEFSEVNNEFVQRCFAEEINSDLVEFLSQHTTLWQKLLAPLLDHLVSDDDSNKGGSN